MPKKILFSLLISAICLASTLSAQTGIDFSTAGSFADEETFLGLGISRSTLSNKAAPSPENHHESGFTLYLDIRTIRLDAGRASTYYSNQLLGDLLLLLQRTVKDANNADAKEGSGISSGLFGWINVGWNLTGTRALQPFLGFNINDYFLTSTYVADTIATTYNRGTYEPQGYWFAGGPLLGLRSSIGEFGILEARSTYSLGYLRAASISNAVKNNDYPNPHFFHLQLEFMTEWGIFASYQTHRLINRGDNPNATRRWDATLGFRFLL